MNYISAGVEEHEDFTAILQREHKEWQDNNFGPQMGYRPLLGMIEELGELIEAFLIHKNNTAPNERVAFGASTTLDIMYVLGRLAHSILKTEQGIRGTEDVHMLEGLKAALAISAFVNNMFSMSGFKQHELSAIYKSMQESNWADCKDTNLADSVGDLNVYRVSFCSAPDIQLDMLECDVNTWNKVKQRNWKENPDTGEVAE